MFRFWRNQREIPLKFHGLISSCVWHKNFRAVLPIVAKCAMSRTMDACFMSFHVLARHFWQWWRRHRHRRNGIWICLEPIYCWMNSSCSVLTCRCHRRRHTMPFTPHRLPLLCHNNVDGTMWKWNVSRWLFVHVARSFASAMMDTQAFGMPRTQHPTAYIRETKRSTNGWHKTYFDSANLSEDLVSTSVAYEE